MRNLLNVVKRRKVVRAVVHAATAFAVLQAADLLTSGLRLPECVFPTITVLLVIGFPESLPMLPRLSAQIDTGDPPAPGTPLHETP
jgi:hypothetical protein